MRTKRNLVHKMITLITIMLLAASVPLFAGGQQETEEIEPEQEMKVERSYKSFEGEHSAQWQFEATEPLIIGGHGDNFAYNGKNVRPTEGTARVEVNTEDNTGTMEAVFNGTIRPEKEKEYSGEIRMVYEKFVGAGSEFKEGGVADFIYLHGDTGQEAPVMPTIKTYLASWGPVDIYVDGELVYEKIPGHMMLTEGARDQETYAIYDSSGEGYYSPKSAGDSSIAHPDRRTLHFVAHTTESDNSNFPPHTAWLHLNFQNVKGLD